MTSPRLADEREAVQKKTFTKWVNSHLARVSCRITDLYTDLRDGRMLIKLLEVLSGERLVSTVKWENIFLKKQVWACLLVNSAIKNVFWRRIE